MADKECFVICPIGEKGSPTRKWSDLNFKYLISPIVEKYGYHPIRADEIQESGMITNQIIDYLTDSALVVADLTGCNPNVFYELAIRHIVQKPYIQMIKSGEKIPFDISGMRTIFFDTQDIELADDAKKMLIEQVESIEKGEFKAINPITLARNSAILQKALVEDVSVKENDPTRLIIESLQGINANMAELRKEISDIKSKQSHLYPGYIIEASRTASKSHGEVFDNVPYIDTINEIKINEIKNKIDNYEKDLVKLNRSHLPTKKESSIINSETAKKKQMLNNLYKELNNLYNERDFRQTVRGQ